MKIAIIGSNSSSATQSMLDFAFRMGKHLVDRGHTIVNGGMLGTMEAAAKGARTSSKWRLNSVIGILPVLDESKGTQEAGVLIRTDLGSGRNRLVVLNGDAVVAIGGGAGTLNEISYAWELGNPIAGYRGAGGWSDKLAGTTLDDRRSDEIVAVASIEDVDNWLTGLEIP